MSRELAERLARELVRCREASGHNRLSVEHFSREEATRRGDEFFVHNTSLLKYERGAWPSPPKLITLARAYGVPISRFLHALGAEDAEICGHVVSPDDQQLFEVFRNPAFVEMHGKLQALIEAEGPAFEAVRLVVELATASLAGSSPQRTADSGGKRFVVEMADDSMIPELRRGDSLLVDRGETAKPGDLVYAVHLGEPLVRQLTRRGERVLLVASSADHREIEIEGDESRIEGVVLKVLERVLSRPGAD